MRSSARIIRKEFAPLNVSCTLVCLSIENSPVTQVYDAANMQFTPDRKLSPLMILPDVVVKAQDGSWDNPDGNPHLADMKWYVNGSPIEDYSLWKAGRDYSIDMGTDEYRGALTIGGTTASSDVNITPGTRLSLSFRAVIADTRRGVNVPIISDEIILSTTDKTEDEYALSIGDGRAIFYNPFDDKLLVYNHEVSIGEVTASDALFEEANDVCSYLREIPIFMFKGSEPLPSDSDYTLKLFRLEGTSFVGLLEGEDELLQFGKDKMTFDMRLVDREGYRLVAYVEKAGKLVQVGSLDFTVDREYPVYRIRPINGIDIHPNDKFIYNEVMVDYQGECLDYPETALQIQWYTDSDTLTEVPFHVGKNTLIELAKTGVGDTISDGNLEIYTDSKQRGARYQAVAKDNETFYTDVEGNILIF